MLDIAQDLCYGVATMRIEAEDWKKFRTGETSQWEGADTGG